MTMKYDKCLRTIMSYELWAMKSCRLINEDNIIIATNFVQVPKCFCF